VASGYTTTTALADSLPTLIASARIIRENEGVMPQLVDKVTLGEGVGLSWNEISLAQLTAQSVTETTELNNPQQISDTLFTVTPSVIGIQTLITDRVAARISKNAYAKIGALAQNAIQRKKDEDGLTVLDGFGQGQPASGSSTLTSGHIGAGVAYIRGNTTEPGPDPIRVVLHGYQLKDIEDELTAGVGTYPVDSGLTARVFKEGFRGMIAGAQIYEDGNISISSNEAKGGVFSEQAIVLVQGRAPRAVAVRAEEIGGGATKVYHYDEYAYGERCDHWGYEILNGLPLVQINGQYGVNCGNSKGKAYDNPQPSLMNDIKVIRKVHRLEVEESTNKTSNSAPHPVMDEEIVGARRKLLDNLLQRCNPTHELTFA